jgi:hypothetical protein
MFLFLPGLYGKFIRFSSKASTIKTSFFLFVFSSLLFLFIMHNWNFKIIDEMYNSEKIMAHIASMSTEQRTVHWIMTATLDVVYPFIYAVFLAGMAYRFLGNFGKCIAPISLICIPFDLAEGFAQIMLLTGSDDFVTLKTIVTPIKLVLFSTGMFFAVVAGFIGLYRKLK